MEGRGREGKAEEGEEEEKWLKRSRILTAMWSNVRMYNNI